MKDIPIDEFLYAYLREYHRGQENVVSSKELEAAFHIGRMELRRAVGRLYCGSHPICSADAGYFYAARRSEVRTTVTQLTGRASKITTTTKSLLQSYKETEG